MPDLEMSSVHLGYSAPKGLVEIPLLGSGGVARSAGVVRFGDSTTRLGALYQQSPSGCRRGKIRLFRGLRPTAALFADCKRQTIVARDTTVIIVVGITFDQMDAATADGRPFQVGSQHHGRGLEGVKGFAVIDD
ncbi:hypothetical protein RZS08_07840, partial [Arthrospira platensis SPKY1]|nr:hypothetical protein [Arthrospira platensis SPKY1]